MRRRLKKNLLVYIGTFLILFLVTDLFVYQWPASRRQQYDNAVQKVLNALEPISNFDKSVLPNMSTVILEPSAGLTCQNSGSGLFLLIMVISAPGHVARRDAIRSTFNEMQPKWEEHFFEEKCLHKIDEHELNVTRVFQLLFFVGQSADDGISVSGSSIVYTFLIYTYSVQLRQYIQAIFMHIQDELRSEWERHGDVIIDDMKESYLKLTVKTLRMMKWTLANCHNAKYLLKMDDDVFLHVPKLLSFLLAQIVPGLPRSSSKLIAGHTYQEVKVDRDPSSKWFTPEAIYEKGTFPVFVAGFCYVMDMSAAQEMYDESRKLPLFHLEDVFLTGLVGTNRLRMELLKPGETLTMMLYYHQLKSLRWALGYVIIHEASVDQFKCWTKLTLEKEKDLSFWWPVFLPCGK